MDKGTLPKRVKKRDGSLVAFNKEKIMSAIERAAFKVLRNKTKSSRISASVKEIIVDKIVSSYKDRIPSVESIQDIVEAALMSEGYSHIAKAYILYREERSEIRMAKSALGLKDDLKLPINTMEVLKRRYLLKDDDQNIIETPSELFRRVAFNVAQAEKRFKSEYLTEERKRSFTK